MRVLEFHLRLLVHVRVSVCECVCVCEVGVRFSSGSQLANGYTQKARYKPMISCCNVHERNVCIVSGNVAKLNEVNM